MVDISSSIPAAWWMKLAPASATWMTDCAFSIPAWMSGILASVMPALL